MQGGRTAPDAGSTLFQVDVVFEPVDADGQRLAGFAHHQILHFDIGLDERLEGGKPKAGEPFLVVGDGVHGAVAGKFDADPGRQGHRHPIRLAVFFRPASLRFDVDLCGLDKNSGAVGLTETERGNDDRERTVDILADAHPVAHCHVAKAGGEGIQRFDNGAADARRLVIGFALRRVNVLIVAAARQKASGVNPLESERGFLTSLFGGHAEPRFRFPAVDEGAAKPAGMDQAKHVLGLHVVLFGGAAIPFDGLRQVVGHAQALPVHVGELELGLGVTGVSGALVPLPRHGVVMRHAFSREEKVAEQDLGLCVAFFGKGPQVIERGVGISAVESLSNRVQVAILANRQQFFDCRAETRVGWGVLTRLGGGEHWRN